MLKSYWLILKHEKHTIVPYVYVGEENHRISWATVHKIERCHCTHLVWSGPLSIIMKVAMYERIDKEPR